MGGPRQDRVDLVILVWASWAEASRPSLSTARELGRKHAPGIEVVTIDLAERAVRVPAAVLRLTDVNDAARDTEDPAISRAGSTDRPPGEEAGVADAGEARATGGSTAPGDETPAGPDGELSTELLRDRLRIDVVPTWIRAAVGKDGTSREVARRAGARPKHEVETDLFRA